MYNPLHQVRGYFWCNIKNILKGGAMPDKPDPGGQETADEIKVPQHAFYDPDCLLHVDDHPGHTSDEKPSTVPEKTE